MRKISSLASAEVAVDRLTTETDYDNIVKVKNNLPAINTIAPSVPDLISLETIHDEIVSLYSDKVKLDSLYTDKGALDGIYSSKAAIDSIFANKAALDSLYADKAKLDSLYADKTTLDAVYSKLAEVEAVGADVLKGKGANTATDSAVLNALDNANVAVAKAGEANTSANSAATSALNASINSSAAAASSTVAENWATYAVDVPVPSGNGSEYSAKHWASKAAAAATGSLHYKGAWDATTAFPAGPILGDYYKVSTAGPEATAPYTYNQGDSIIYNGTGWDLIDSSDAVNSVDGQVGAVNLTSVYEPKNSNIQAHIASTANPHGVTKAQVGLGNVDNTSDVNKPVSTAQDARFTAVEATANAAAPQSTTYSKTEVDNKIVGFKNLIINGGFDVWQRGTLFAYPAGTSGYHTADRAILSNNSDGQFTASKSEINGSNAVKFNVDTAITGLTTKKYWNNFSYYFEGRTLYSIARQGKTVTLSFWFNSNVAGDYPISFRNWTVPNNVESYVSTFNYTTANVPQKVEVVIPLNHTFSGVLVNNNAVGFTLTIGFLNQGAYVTSTTNSWQTGNYLTTPTCVNWGATAGNFIEIAELQLEEGSVATTFERRPYGLELSLCQRYYWTTMVETGNYTDKGFIELYATGTVDFYTQQFLLPVEQRITGVQNVYNPVTGVQGSIYNSTSGVSYDAFTLGIAGSFSRNKFYLFDSNMGLTAGNNYSMHLVSDAEIY